MSAPVTHDVIRRETVYGGLDDWQTKCRLVDSVIDQLNERTRQWCGQLCLIPGSDQVTVHVSVRLRGFTADDGRDTLEVHGTLKVETTL